MHQFKFYISYIFIISTLISLVDAKTIRRHYIKELKFHTNLVTPQLPFPSSSKLSLITDYNYMGKANLNSEFDSYKDGNDHYLGFDSGKNTHLKGKNHIVDLGFQLKLSENYFLSLGANSSVSLNQNNFTARLGIGSIASSGDLSMTMVLSRTFGDLDYSLTKDIIDDNYEDVPFPFNFTDYVESSDTIAINQVSEGKGRTSATTLSSTISVNMETTPFVSFELGWQDFNSNEANQSGYLVSYGAGVKQKIFEDLDVYISYIGTHFTIESKRVTTLKVGAIKSW